MQWRAVRIGALAAAVAIVFFTVRWLRSMPAPRVAAVEVVAPPRTAAPPIVFEELGTSFQGPLQQKDKDEGWMVLTIQSDGASDPMRFHYTFNVFTVGQQEWVGRGDDGELSLARGTVRFGDFHGTVRRDGRGKVVLQSNSIDGPPYWLLEPMATTESTTTAE